MSSILKLLIKSSENGCMDCCCCRIKPTCYCCCYPASILTYNEDERIINIYYKFINGLLYEKFNKYFEKAEVSKIINVKEAYKLYTENISKSLVDIHKKFLESYPELKPNKYIDRIKTKLIKIPTESTRLNIDITDCKIFHDYDYIVNNYWANNQFITLINEQTGQRKYLYIKVHGHKNNRYKKHHVIKFKKYDKKCKLIDNKKCKFCINYDTDQKNCKDCNKNICCLKGMRFVSEKDNTILYLRKRENNLIITGKIDNTSSIYAHIQDSCRTMRICSHVFNNIERLIKFHNLYETLINNHKMEYGEWLKIFKSKIEIQSEPTPNNSHIINLYAAEFNKITDNKKSLSHIVNEVNAKLLHTNAFSYKFYDVLDGKIKSKRQCVLYIFIVIFILLLIIGTLLSIVLPITLKLK